MNSFGENLPWLLVHRHSFWKGPWPWGLGLVIFPLFLATGQHCDYIHTHTHTHSCKNTHYISLAVRGVKNQGHSELTEHKWLNYSCTFHDFDFHILWNLQARSQISSMVFSHREKGFNPQTVFIIQRDSWGGDGCRTNVHKQHKQKRHRIFMRLKQGCEVQCKQISRLYLL